MIKSDFLVIGSGIAGLSFALKVAEHGDVVVITKKSESESSTNYAQGGIAIPVGADDSEEQHIQDTLKTGLGLSREDVVRSVIGDGARVMNQLIEWGCEFTRGQDGNFSLGREGGHSRNRIIHAADLTGREIERALLDKAGKHPNITLLPDHATVDLITEHSLEVRKKHKDVTCYGAYVLDVKRGKVETFTANKTLLATGGTGQVYLHTSNPEIATGDGIASAYRAGAKVGNLEFMQFHPTTFKTPQEKNFLITEAVRGYGGIIVNIAGERIMEKHPQKDLAPRDIVAQTIDLYLKNSGEKCVYLDITGMDRETTRKRFPNIYEKCLVYGVDITSEPIPVVPAAHYMCGGVATDMWGRTSINNLYAAGEVAFTGIHGANRLASNSLLEAVVMADRAAAYVVESQNSTAEMPDVPDWSEKGTFNQDEWVIIAHDRNNIRSLMWDLVGIVRSDFRLRRALNRIGLIRDEVEEYYRKTKLSLDLVELRNLAIVASLIVMSAKHRKESRGLHYTTDYPYTDETLWKHDTYIQNEEILS